MYGVFEVKMGHEGVEECEWTLGVFLLHHSSQLME